MPSSLIFAALAAAWLVVLVPMFARRRQEVSKTTDSALAARVVRRGGARGRAPADSGGAVTDGAQQEAYGMADTDRQDIETDDVDDYGDEAQTRGVHSDDVRAGRRYRPGRGGYDPEAAALAARAKYARRQRILLVMVALAVVTGVIAGFALPAVWWLHALVDLSIVGYLTYLRRQVRIETEIRERRLARMSGARHETEADYDDEYEYDDEYDYADEPAEDADDYRDQERAAREARRSNAVVVDIDDEDPMFDELDERTWRPYRRAVGE